MEVELPHPHVFPHKVQKAEHGLFAQAPPLVLRADHEPAHAPPGKLWVIIKQDKSDHDAVGIDGPGIQALFKPGLGQGAGVIRHKAALLVLHL